jgi:hypothetical protein
VHKKVCTIIANILPLIRNDVKVLRVNKLARTARYAAGELGYGFLDKTGPEFRKPEHYSARSTPVFSEDFDLVANHMRRALREERPSKTTSD